MTDRGSLALKGRASRFGVAAAACIALGAPACKYSHETVPEARSVTPARVPNQQRLIALAIEDAVEALNFKALAGKTVTLELAGVFPHSGDDAFNYLTQQVEAKLARSGVRLLGIEGEKPPPETRAPPTMAQVEPARPGPLATPAEEPSWLHPGRKRVAPPPPPPPPAPVASKAPVAPATADYRLLLGVAWGGIDTRDKVRTDEPLLFGQVSLAAGGLLGGSALLMESDSTFRQAMSATLMVGAVAGAITWFVLKSPFPHTYTLMGRFRVVVRGIPIKDGTAFTTEGTGTSKIIVDERNPEGFELDGRRIRVIDSERPETPIREER